MRPADPTLSLAERIDAVCDRFEAEWKAGRDPRIEAYVSEMADSDRDALRDALIGIERELKARASGETSVSQASVKSDDRSPELTAAHVGASVAPASIGRFEIRGVLGAGAFGKVYRAFDPQLDREVAIKVPLESAVKTDKERTQFLKEARAAATINHPNVCQVYEVGEADGRPFIVMAIVPGQSLAAALKARTEPMPEKQAAMIVRKVAIALDAAHGKGVVHRDLKPANILFDRERKDVIVMDFGLARGPRMGPANATQSGVVMGTPAYMSPEQARGDSKDVGPAGDVFSLGVIFYELLTGQRPFTGTATEVIGKILHVEPESPAHLRSGLDPRLNAACSKAMAKDPAARFASMKEFAKELDIYLRSPIGPASETTRAEATRRDGDAAGSTARNLAEVFAADRQQARVETAAAIESAIAKYRTPSWLFVLIGVAFLGVLTALGGLVLVTRSDKVRVTIELTDIDLKDRSLSFVLDERPISAEDLAAPIELSPGEHVLVVKRGEDIVRRLLFTVVGGPSPNIRMKDITPPPNPPANVVAKSKAVWKPLVATAEDLVLTGNSEFADGKLTLSAPGMARTNFTGKNYIVRAKAQSIKNSVFLLTRSQPGVGHYACFFNDRTPLSDNPTCGVGKSRPEKNWEDLLGTAQGFGDTRPPEVAVSVFNDEIAIYVNGFRMVAARDVEHSEGAIAFTCYRENKAVLSDIEVCVLDGTRLTPNDVYPQKPSPDAAKWLSPEFLTSERKKENLLANGDFEAGYSGDWKYSGWRNLASAHRIVASPVHSGTKSLMFSHLDNDSSRYSQIVPVTPHQKYLFSGWIKTKRLTFDERDPKGAYLYVPGQYLHCTARSMPADMDWTYYAVVFDAYDRNRVEVGPSLGVFAGTCRGTAWFDDLCLIPLPEGN